jgi:hypothetical protein
MECFPPLPPLWPRFAMTKSEEKKSQEEQKDAISKSGSPKRTTLSNFKTPSDTTLCSSRGGWLSVLRRCLPRRGPGFYPQSRPNLHLVW